MSNARITRRIGCVFLVFSAVLAIAPYAKGQCPDVSLHEGPAPYDVPWVQGTPAEGWGQPFFIYCPDATQPCLIAFYFCKRQLSTGEIQIYPERMEFVGTTGYYCNCFRNNTTSYLSGLSQAILQLRDGVAQAAGPPPCGQGDAIVVSICVNSCWERYLPDPPDDNWNHIRACSSVSGCTKTCKYCMMGTTLHTEECTSTPWGDAGCSLMAPNSMDDWDFWTCYNISACDW